MKDLRIPIPSDQSVDLSEINPDFKGIVIGYKGDQATGFIQYYDHEWYFMTDIDFEGNAQSEDSPLELINSLIRLNICNHFKVIEFEKY